MAFIPVVSPAPLRTRSAVLPLRHTLGAARTSRPARTWRRARIVCNDAGNGGDAENEASSKIGHAVADAPSTSSDPSSTPSQEAESASPPKLQRYFETFSWRGHSINYRVEGPADGEPVLLVHGFGASVNHFRKNIPALVDTGRLRVYAIDLLGFGGSDKPPPGKDGTGVTYSLELWRDLVVDFVNAQDAAMGVARKWAFVGNSIGSLISIMAVDALGESRVRGCALVNCAGGLVSFRYSELNVLQRGMFWLFNTVLFNRFTGPGLFERFRTRENVSGVLQQVYMDATAITDELVDILCEPALDEGACAVFLAIFNADAGPAPEPILERMTWCPTLVIWGGRDPWTPLRTGVHPGEKFVEYHPGIDLRVIEEGGHCLHDECPDKVNAMLGPFLTEPRLKEVKEAGEPV